MGLWPESWSLLLAGVRFRPTHRILYPPPPSAFQLRSLAALNAMVNAKWSIIGFYRIQQDYHYVVKYGLRVWSVNVLTFHEGWYFFSFENPFICWNAFGKLMTYIAMASAGWQFRIFLLSLGIFLISNRVHRDDFQFFIYSPTVNEILLLLKSVLSIEEWSYALFSRCHLSDSFSGFFKMSPWWKLRSHFSKLKLLLLHSLCGFWLKEHLKFLKACVPPTPHTVNFIRTLYRWWYSF